jgi:hypothetical protein
MTRVCRPGGTVGMLAFRPEGAGREFFELLASYAPESDGPSPLLWGDEEHVRALFAGGTLTLTRGSYVERVPGGPRGYVDLCLQTFGPAIAIRGGLGAERAAAFDRDFLDFAERHHDDGGITYDYLLIRLQAPRR